MPYDVIIGRSEEDKRKLGKKGTIFLGRSYVKMGQTTSLSNNILLDIARAHVILIAGKRGSGKSFTLGVLAEEISNLPEDVANNLSVLIFDTMGIFWTMKHENVKEEDLLRGWGIKPRPLDKIDVFVPGDKFDEYKEQGIPVDHKFYLRPSELDAGDWCLSFDVDLNSSLGILIEKIISDLKGKDYSVEDIISSIRKEKEFDRDIKNAAINRFIAAKSWGVFNVNATKLKDIVDNGRVTVLDLSVYSNTAGNWGIKNLVTGILCKKLLEERMASRRIEEIESIEAGRSYVGLDDEFENKEKMPLVWLLIDEAHEFLPKEGKTAATDALVQLLREGRQPGISMVLATQQPGEIHKDVITQSDIVISHRVTARKDITALNDIMQTYLLGDIQRYLNDLPRFKGSAILLDDNSERIYPIKVRPRFTWHGGEAPSAIKVKRRELLELGI